MKTMRVRPAQLKTTEREPPWCFLKGLRRRDRDMIDKAFTPVEKAAMAEGSGVTGGYLLPTAYTTEFMRGLAEESIFWPRSSVWSFTGRTGVGPTFDATTVQSAAVAPWWGGMRAYWGTEGVQPTESEPAFQQVSFTAWDLLIDCLASNQFVADMGADGEQRLIYEFGRASAWYVDYAFFNGTGSGGQMPLGILKAPCKKTVSRVVAGHVSQTDVGAMVASLLPRCYRTAVWACSPTAIEDVIKLPGMQPNQPAIPAMGEESSLCGVLFGRPVFVTEKLPAMGTAGDLILFDPAEYLIGDRQQVTIDASEHPRFRNNQTTFRVWVRVDNKPLLSDTVTLADGTTEVSSVVVLG